MRGILGGLLLASVLLMSACSDPQEAAGPTTPAPLSISLEPNTNGVLEARSARVLVGTGAKTYAAQVAMTPTWWVTGDGFKIVWFAGRSQTRRYFQITSESPGESARPELLKAPEGAVREVKVAFDGALPMSVRPEATRAVFQPPPGARAVTSVEITFGPANSPVTYTWR